MNDERADLDKKAMRLVDIATLAGAKADMMQTDITLDETLALRSRRWRFDAEAGSRTDAIVDARRIRDDLQPQERQQLAVEGARRVEVSRGDEDMGDAVDFHRMHPPFLLTVQNITAELSRLVSEGKGCNNSRRHGARVRH